MTTIPPPVFQGDGQQGHNAHHAVLTCSVCHEIPHHDPVITATCQHIFCRSCIIQSTSLRSECPNDRQPLTDSDILPLSGFSQRIWDVVGVSCPAGDDCDWKGNLGNYATHYETQHITTAEYRALLQEQRKEVAELKERLRRAEALLVRELCLTNNNRGGPSQQHINNSRRGQQQDTASDYSILSDDRRSPPIQVRVQRQQQQVTTTGDYSILSDDRPSPPIQVRVRQQQQDTASDYSILSDPSSLPIPAGDYSILSDPSSSSSHISPEWVRRQQQVTASDNNSTPPIQQRVRTTENEIQPLRAQEAVPPLVHQQQSTHSDSNMMQLADDFSSGDDDDSEKDNEEDIIGQGPTQITVQNAGLSIVNGVYMRHGSHENAPVYLKVGEWNNTPYKFYICLYTFSDHGNYWCISVVPFGVSPGLGSGVDFYATPQTEARSSTIPPKERWFRLDAGADPPPKLVF